MKTNKFTDQLVDYHIGMPTDFKKPINYIMTGSGLKTVRENGIGVFVLPATTVPGLEKMEDTFIMKLPKMPISVLFRIINFFKWVNTKHDAEAMMHVYYDQTKKEYFCHCPEQTVGGAAVKFEKQHELEQTHMLVMDIHSHNTMSAFFSGTDDNDEKETRIFGVIGNIEELMPEMKFRAGSGEGKIEDLKLEDIFDLDSKFPEEWKEKVKKEAVVATVYKSKTSGLVSNYHKNWEGEYGYYKEGHYKNYYGGLNNDDAPEVGNKKKKKKKKHNKFILDEFNSSGEAVVELSLLAEDMEHEDIHMLIEELKLIEKKKEDEIFGQEAIVGGIRG